MTKRKAPEDKLKAGAPTKYKPEYCEEMLKYFKKARDIFKKSDKPSFGKQDSKEFLEFPTFQGFAVFEVDVCYQTLLDWRKAYPEFLDAYNKCKAIQEQILVKGGLSKAYDPTFSKFILNSVSDTFKEKVTIEADEETKGIVRLAYNLPMKKEE